MASEILNTLLILGAAQGLFLAVLLATKHTNSTANRLLAVAMLSFSLYILAGVYYAREYYLAVPAFIGASVPLPFAFGPIHYLYARTVSAGGHGFRKIWLLHFVPFALVVLYLTPFYLSTGSAKLAYLQALERNGPPADLNLIQQLLYPHGICYVLLTISLLRRHHRRLEDNFSSIEHINLRWLRNFTIGVAVVWALATALHLLELAGIVLGPIESRLTPVGVAILVYAAGYLGLRQPEIFHGHSSRRTPVVPGPGETLGTAMPGHGDAAEVSPSTPLDEGDDGAYQKSGLTESEAASLMDRLQRVMAEKRPYLDSQLTLQDLAEELAISPHNLSEVINTQAGKNFYDFVNGYRVEEAKRRLRDPRHANLTILAVATDSGFNSKATFNAFFKRSTGQTPSQYRAGPATPA